VGAEMCIRDRAVMTTVIKVNKDAAEARGLTRVARVPDDQPKARIAQIWLLEEGDLRDQVIDVTKFQGFVFTLVILWVYVGLAWAGKVIPELPENVVTLIGISHAGYVGGKMPNRPTKDQRNAMAS